MRDILIVFGLVIFWTSCSNQIENKTVPLKFSIKHIFLKADTTIRSISHQGEYLICLQDDGRILVLDTAYDRVENLEKNFSSIKSSFLFKYHDTLFFGNKSKEYYLSDNFLPNAYKATGKVYGDVLFEDSLYLVYGCCVGEFGGSIFFMNKRSSKTYSYFATCANQVLRFKNDYVVCNNLAHMGEHMSFLIVKDPTTLYELTDEKLKNDCNWYTGIDSLRNYWERSNVGNVRFYDAYNAMSLVTFPFQDSLYSIISAKKTTLLKVHRGDTTIVKDTLLNRKISFHEAQVIEMGDRKVCLYRLTEGSPVAAYWTRGNNTGLIVVRGNEVDFLERMRN